ncbi:MAG: hypothetical protein U0694_06525 [Anaerolineae bacterium]
MTSEKSTVSVFWDGPEKTVLIYKFAAVWNWADFYEANAKGHALIDDVPHKVAVIFSGPANVRLPENFLNNVVQINRARHARTKMAIVVINNAFVRAMFNTLSRLYSGELRGVVFVNSLEAARIVAAGGQKAPHD